MQQVAKAENTGVTENRRPPEDSNAAAALLASLVGDIGVPACHLGRTWDMLV